MLISKKRTKTLINAWILNRLVPEDHEAMKIGKTVDFEFVPEEAKDFYSKAEGRPNWPLVMLFKMLFLQCYDSLSDLEVCSVAKRSHSLGKARYQGLPKMGIQPLMTFIVISVKRVRKAWFEALKYGCKAFKEGLQTAQSEITLLKNYLPPQ